ncbi:hypothetical protein BDD12DRAFT_884930 [Trichophaea hybrida]|nr:hypothetical protein BDD12DRAFT_884930 [Trichophaea hybrida]
MAEIGLRNGDPSICSEYCPGDADITREKGTHLVKADQEDPDLWQLQKSMKILHLKENKTNGTPPILYSAYDNVTAEQWKPDFGFSSTKTIGDVSNDEKWAHITECKPAYGTSMISTSESESWTRNICLKRMNGGRPERYVGEMKTKRIRTPIRRASQKS